MNKFEKVSFEEFRKDCLNLHYEESEIQAAYDAIVLPKRGTTGSAGYDFVTPFAVDIDAEHPVKVIPTGVRCSLDQDKVLVLVPRSGTGFKTGTRLSNTMGVIDSDYYYADNEGHMMVSLFYGFKPLHLNRGDRFCQGMILQYFTTDDDSATESRHGGFGSTGSK